MYMHVHVHVHCTCIYYMLYIELFMYSTLYTCSRSPFFTCQKHFFNVLRSQRTFTFNTCNCLYYNIILSPSSLSPPLPLSPSTHTNTQSQDAVAPTAVGQSLSTLLTAAPPTMLTSSPNFSFSAPKSVSSESGPSQSTSKQTLKQVSQSTYFTEHILVANNI